MSQLETNIQTKNFTRRLAEVLWSIEKDRIKKRNLKKYHQGEQDLIDVLSYTSLNEEKDYLEVDNKFYRVLYISGYPYVATVGWLNNLININTDVDISYHIEQIDPLVALPKLERKITELESTRRVMLKEGRVIGSEITDPLESAWELKDKILRGQEKLFQVSIYIMLSAESLAELDKNTQILESILAQRLFFTKTAIFQQIDGFQSILPRAQNLLNQKRNLDTSSAALTFPFISSEMVHESGILYGINKSNNSLVIIDRFNLNNANSIIFAQSGSGKSYTAKVEILRQLMQGTKVIIIDPEREYKQLANSVNGSYIKLSTKSKEKINPFEINLNRESHDQKINDQIQDLTEIVGILVGNLSNEERAILDKTLVDIYKKFESINSKSAFPLLRDLYKELEKKKLVDLCHRLDRFVSGSLSNVFDGQTNINLDNRLVVFDIKDLPESLRQVMMVIISNYVQNKVMQLQEKRMLIIDEAWLLLQQPESAKFISNLTRRARKHYLGVTIISQQAADFLNHDYGKVIASQSALRILMRQDTTTINTVAQEFQLSEFEKHFLLTCDRGEGIIIADQNHVAVKVVASEKEHPLITTDPKELYI